MHQLDFRYASSSSDVRPVNISFPRHPGADDSSARDSWCPLPSTSKPALITPNRIGLAPRRSGFGVQSECQPTTHRYAVTVGRITGTDS